MGRIAALFPGQGAQFAGMGRDLAEVSPAAREVFAEANTALGFDLASLCFEGTTEQLEATDIQQPAILTVSVAAWRAFRERGGSELRFEAAAGLSLGEYAALHVAGAISFAEAVRLVYRRGQLMQSAAVDNPGAMVSVLGLSEQEVRQICMDVTGHGVLQPANFNCPGQVVVSGSGAACQAAVAAVEARGGRAVPLKVAGAFHSPLMTSAAQALQRVLAEVEFRPPTMRVVANVLGRYYQPGDSVADLLAAQVTSPILWQKSMELLISDGFDRFLEFGPGRVLAGLMRKIDRKVKVDNIGRADSLQQVAAV